MSTVVIPAHHRHRAGVPPATDVHRRRRTTRRDGSPFLGGQSQLARGVQEGAERRGKLRATWKVEEEPGNGRGILLENDSEASARELVGDGWFESIEKTDAGNGHRPSECVIVRHHWSVTVRSEVLQPIGIDEVRDGAPSLAGRRQAEPRP